MKRNIGYCLTVFGVLGCLLISAPVWAENDTEEGTFEGEAVAGAQADAGQENPDSAKFEEYRDVPNGVILEHLELLWKPRDRWFLEMQATDATQRDQSASFVFGMDKYWKTYITWQENPRRFMDTAVTPYAMNGGMLLLPDTLQLDIQNAKAGASTCGPGAAVSADCPNGGGTYGTQAYILKDALNNAPYVDVNYQRSTGNAGVEATPGEHWVFRLDAQREKRLGTMPQTLLFGSSPGASPAEVAAPIDFRTDTATGSAEFVYKRLSVGANVMVSSFSNEYSTLIIDNPLRATDSSSATKQARFQSYPDNSFQQYRLYAATNLPFWNARFYGAASYGQTRQNDPFVPLTINTAINQGTTRDFNGDGVVDAADDPELLSALPARSLNGRYDTNTLEFRATARPISWLRLKSWWRSYERDDRSGDFLLVGGYVGGDSGLSSKCSDAAEALGACEQDPVLLADTPIQRARAPFDYTKKNYGLDARLGHFGPVAFGVGFERESWEREHAAVTDSDEDTLKLVADLDATDWLFLRATYKNQERDAGHYDPHYTHALFPTGEPNEFAFNEGMRRFYWTDRDRDAYTLLVDVSPMEKVSFYGEATYAKNEYFDPNTGTALGGSYTDDSGPRDCDGDDADNDGIIDSTEGTTNLAATPEEDCNILLAGRTSDKNRSYTVGVSFTPFPRFNAFVDYTWETLTYAMSSRYRAGVKGATVGGGGGYDTDNPADNWGTDVKDRYNTWNLGFNAELVKNKTRLNGVFSYSTSRDATNNWYTPGGSESGDGISTKNGVTTPLAFPTIRTRLTTATLALDQRVRKNLDFIFRWQYEEWKDDNWSADGMAPYLGDDTIVGVDNGNRTSVWLGGNFKDYQVHIAQFLVRVKI